MTNPPPPPYPAAMIAMFSHAGLESSQHLNETEMRAFETLIGRKTASVLFYNSWTTHSHRGLRAGAALPGSASPLLGIVLADQRPGQYTRMPTG